jgi:hypothetical protein
MTEPQRTSPIRQIAATELPTRWGVFRALGFERRPDSRRSPETALVLNKSRALANAGIAVVEQIPCEAPPSSYSTGYLGTKKHRMGHTLTLV